MILYAIGVEQSVSSMYNSGIFTLSLVGLIKVSWLPLNFIMIPVLLTGMSIGYNSNDMFDTMNVSRWQKMLAKILTLAMFDGIIMLSNVLIFVIIAVLSKVSLCYAMYQFTGYFINTFIFLIVCGAIGLFFGKVISKYLGSVISTISAILLFLLLCNFYKTDNFILPLIDLRTISNSFDVISYDKSYIYHNILWLIIALIILMSSFAFKNLLIKWGSYLSLFVICIFLIWNMHLVNPTFYDITIKAKVGDSGHNPSRFKTYYNKDDRGYYVDKYKMSLNIGDELENNCEMEIVINGNSVKAIELGLFGKLNIKSVEVNSEKQSFTRTNNSFKVELPKEYKNGENIKMKVQYAGIINTVWSQGQQFFHARSNSIFLADVFEWYPKLNDDRLKEYDIDVKYSGTNKIYSNLNYENKSKVGKLIGKDKEVFLVSNRMVEKNYKNYLLVGNEESINNDTLCDDIIRLFGENNSDDKKKIIFGLAVPGTGAGEDYKNAYLK